MNSEAADLLGNDNPFLEGLAELLNPDRLEQRLARSPLSNFDIKNASIQDRLDMLDRMQDEMFEPTQTSIQLITNEFRLIRRGYLARNPKLAATRNRTMGIANFTNLKLTELPWFPTYAKGMRVAGETGTGKSYEIYRGLELLPSTIARNENRKAGWTCLTQIIWLYVPMSHDGSLGGLLLSILCALDQAAGTDYSTKKSITGLSNEKLAVRIGILLRTHAVGVLVIDELQSRNFRGDGGLAATFFLRILNFGIPMILVGNPLGLAPLDRFSQDMRRMSAGGSFDMRAMSADDFDWTDCLAPALWRFDVMPEQTHINDPEGAILFQYSGGIRDYACRIRVESQRIALQLGALAVTMEHMELAFNGNSLSDRDRAFIHAFRDRDALALRDWEDVRWKEYALKWGSNPGASPPQGAGAGDDLRGSDNAEASSPVASKMDCERDRKRVDRQRTRKNNALTRQSAIQRELDEDDMRRDGMQEYLISELEQLRPKKN